MIKLYHQFGSTACGNDINRNKPGIAVHAGETIWVTFKAVIYPEGIIDVSLTVSFDAGAVAPMPTLQLVASGSCIGDDDNTLGARTRHSLGAPRPTAAAAAGAVEAAITATTGS
jgi:hypothetical protein